MLVYTVSRLIFYVTMDAFNCYQSIIESVDGPLLPCLSNEHFVKLAAKEFDIKL